MTDGHRGPTTGHLRSLAAAWLSPVKSPASLWTVGTMPVIARAGVPWCVCVYARAVSKQDDSLFFSDASTLPCARAIHSHILSHQGCVSRWIGGSGKC